MPKSELNIAIPGQLAALHRRVPTVATVSNQGQEKKRRMTWRNTQLFDSNLQEFVLCFYTLSMFLHAITLKYFKNLCHHFDSEGLLPHIQHQKLPHNALQLGIRMRIMRLTSSTWKVRSDEISNGWSTAEMTLCCTSAYPVHRLASNVNCSGADAQVVSCHGVILSFILLLSS